MSGFQEILVILLIIAVVFFLPRMTGRGRTPARSRGPVSSAVKSLSGRTRLAILLSVIWTASASFYCKPWQGDPLPFLSVGIAPVAIGWGLLWVLAGFRK